MNQKIVYLVLCVVFLGGILALGAMMFDSEEMEHDEMKDKNLDKMDENTTETGTQTATENTMIKFTTNYGEFEVKLYTQKSPITAGNFEELVEKGFYDGTRFHRVIDGFMIQGGDPQSKNKSLKTRWGTGGPGYTIEDEFIQGLSNTKFTLSMANSGPQSGGSQFFINVADNTFLDWDKQPLQSKHPVFGEVVSGSDIVLEISKVDTTQGVDRPIEDVIIEKVVIVQ